MWSQLEPFSGARRALAVGALCLAAAWKQPRGVFTVTTPRYDDGRRQLRMSLRELFLEAVTAFNRAVFAGPPCQAVQGDVFAIDPEPYALAYLDPPYAPPRDDADYIKRYHFLEGLATYGATRRSCGRPARASCASGPRRSPTGAPPRTPWIARSPTSGAARSSSPTAPTPRWASTSWRPCCAATSGIVRRVEIPHFYGFGTHAAARRRAATEYVLVAS